MVSAHAEDQPLSEGDVRAGLKAPTFLLLKHSGRCGISTSAKRAFERFRAAYPHIPGGWIDVIGQRTLSNELAERLGVTHASPQLLWLESGQLRFHANHFDITELALREQLAAD